MSTRDSVVSTTSSTSRFSSLLTPAAAQSARSSSVQLSAGSSAASTRRESVATSVGGTSATSGTATAKRASALYERPLKPRGTEVALSAWAFMFSEIIQYTQRKVSGIGEFEKRLNVLGYRVGVRLVELLPLRDVVQPMSSLRSPPPPTRTIRLLPLLTYIHSTLYRYLFGRTADSLEKSTDNDDEYMIGDDDMLVTRSIEVPKEMSELSCGAFVAGIVEAVMDSAGFPSRVTSHQVPAPGKPRKTVILIKIDPSVREREAVLSGKS